MKEILSCGTCLLKLAQNEETFFVKDLQKFCLKELSGAIIWGQFSGGQLLEG